MGKVFFALIMTSCLFSLPLIGTDLKPWYGNLYSIDLEGTCRLQQFQKISTKCGTIKRPEFDAFYDFSALMVVKEDLTAEIEISALDSRQRLFGFDAFRLTGKYFWLSDVTGDPVSLATGITLSKIFSAARRNIATFDHGGIACEAHVAIGKELSCEQFWTSRTWAVLGLGIADVGLPWLRANLVWERNWWEIHQLKIFAKSLWGFGQRDLNLKCSFQGYGSINYQTIDVGFCYGLRLDNDALLSVAYAYRVYGKNCPINANSLQLEIHYPFGL